MKKQIKKFLSQFPDNATCWSQATDEVRDLARKARQIYNEIDLDLTEDEVLEEGKGLQPLNFRALRTPADWNTQGKAYIIATFDKMSAQAKDLFFNSNAHWFKA